MLLIFRYSKPCLGYFNAECRAKSRFFSRKLKKETIFIW